MRAAGFKLTEEHKKKLSIAHTGKKLTEEHKKNLRIALLGKNLGNRHSDETKRKISEAGLGRRHSYETRKKMSDSKKGSKSHLWKGGISRRYKLGYKSLEYTLWRCRVFRRDDWTCQECGYEGYVTAHHIKSFANYPELRYEVDNGITLCEPCHSKTDNYKGRNRRSNKL